MWLIKPSRFTLSALLLLACVLLPVSAGGQDEPPIERPAATNTCLTCHSGLGGGLSTPTKPFSEDIHAEKGLTCASCHGGDPTSMDMQVAMNPAKGFRGRPSRRQIPSFCGRCHSDATYMHNFNPSVRTYHVAQYRTSQHGQLLRQGDQQVATCIDCHSVHDIKLVSDPTAPVYPLNIPETCSRCHSNDQYMGSCQLPGHTQVADYEQSVHYEALTVQEDLSAPTCVTCHGSHGATPPGVRSVADVCGTCHANNQELFANSPHQAVFDLMGVPGCVGCHSNHAILRTNEQMLAPGPESICLGCHAPDDGGAERAKVMADQIVKLSGEIQLARETLEQADRAGMEVSVATAELTAAHSHWIMARTEIHSLDVERVAGQISQGLEVAARATEQGREKLAEVQSRRKGLAVSTLFILIVVFSLYFYIRENEKVKKDS